MAQATHDYSRLTIFRMQYSPTPSATPMQYSKALRLKRRPSRMSSKSAACSPPPASTLR